MDKSNQIASDLAIYTKYAKHISKEDRRETWEEIVERCMKMHIKRYPSIKGEIEKAFKEMVLTRKVLPSMRSLQFSGKPIERNNTRIYNCAYHSASRMAFFHHTMFLLLGGTGVGLSVQERHINQLPTIKQPGRPRKFLIQDSIEGWADAVKVLCKAYFYGRYLPRYDYSDVRAKGTPLKTAGGLAPGPAPLRECLTRMLGVFENKPTGSRLTSKEVCDIACYIAQAVLSGGIRRSAMICLFDPWDVDMLGYKAGKWFEKNPQRAMVNISAAMKRDEADHGRFTKLWSLIKAGGSGEPGIYWTNNLDLGTNPCCEISLKDRQFCNLTTINFTTVKDQKDLEERGYYAAFIGTLQAGYTDFHYLGESWKDNCDEEGLLGVSVTGIADGNCYRGYNWEKVAEKVKEANRLVAKSLEITCGARLTCIKPEGTSSLVLGASSGIHPRHSLYYIRRFRFGNEEPIAKFLCERHPEITDKDYANPRGIVVELPVKSPERSIYRSESPEELLERVKFFHENWIAKGHVSGKNTHNVSCTVSIKPDEWGDVGEWMWENRDYYNGLAVVPYDLASYQQPPFEEITKEEYESRLKKIRKIDFKAIKETKDGTALVMAVACAGPNGCEIT